MAINVCQKLRQLFCPECNNDSAANCRECWVETICNLIEIAQTDKWIPVGEKLPQKNETVLVYGKLYKYAPADGEGDYPMWPWQDTPIAPRGAFVKLWDSTVPKSKLPQCGFAANPWVWAYRFERCSNPFTETEAMP